MLNPPVIGLQVFESKIYLFRRQGGNKSALNSVLLSMNGNFKEGPRAVRDLY